MAQPRVQCCWPGCRKARKVDPLKWAEYREECAGLGARPGMICPTHFAAAAPGDDCRGRKPLESRCQGAAYILAPYNEDNTIICDAALDRRLAQKQPLTVDNPTGNGLRLLRETEPSDNAETGEETMKREPASPSLKNGIR